jgi:hypothetical protein
LPVHIVARLLGHANLSTTQAYMAVFDEELVRSCIGVRTVGTTHVSGRAGPKDPPGSMPDSIVSTVADSIACCAVDVGRLIT